MSSSQEKRICVVCGRSFVPSRFQSPVHQVCCCAECRRIRRNTLARKNYAALSSPSGSQRERYRAMLLRKKEERLRRLGRLPRPPRRVSLKRRLAGCERLLGWLCTGTLALVAGVSTSEEAAVQLRRLAERGRTLAGDAGIREFLRSFPSYASTQVSCHSLLHGPPTNGVFPSFA